MWEDPNDWYEHQKQFDRHARIASESQLGAGMTVFADAMRTTANALDRAAEGGPYFDAATKRAIGLAAHAFNLLWSAWDAALAGRYEAAAAFRRSISEVPDLLMALLAKPAFATQMRGDSSDINTARRIVRDALNGSGPGSGKDWLKFRDLSAKKDQPFAHVSFEAVAAGLGVGTQDGDKIGALRPGGAPSGLTMKIVACELALSAAALAPLASALFLGQEGSSALERVSVWNELIQDELNKSIVPKGEMKTLLLLRSTEHPPQCPQGGNKEMI